MPANFNPSDPTQIDTLGLVAFIDFETRLPFQTRSGGMVSTYEFEKPPTEKLILPEDLSTQIQAGKEARLRLSQPAGRPY